MSKTVLTERLILMDFVTSFSFSASIPIMLCLYLLTVWRTRIMECHAEQLLAVCFYTVTMNAQKTMSGLLLTALERSEDLFSVISKQINWCLLVMETGDTTLPVCIMSVYCLSFDWVKNLRRRGAKGPPRALFPLLHALASLANSLCCLYHQAQRTVIKWPLSV